MKRKNIRRLIGYSVIWLYITMISATFFFLFILYYLSQGYSYGLFNAGDTLLIIMNDIGSVWTNLCVLILMIYLQHNLSSIHKLQLKNHYSHNLENMLQKIYSTAELIQQRENVQMKRILEYTDEASKIIGEIRNL